MKITELITQTVEITENILCNRCNQSLKAKCGGYEGLLSSQVFCGYDSKLGDMNEYRFDLCEDCLIWLFATFKHDPLYRVHEIID